MAIDLTVEFDPHKIPGNEGVVLSYSSAHDADENRPRRTATYASLMSCSGPEAGRMQIAF